MINPQYLGDAVYAHLADDGLTLVITTEHYKPCKAGNTVFLEPSVQKALVDYINNIPRVVEAQRNENEIRKSISALQA
jgi:hypothetical protein